MKKDQLKRFQQLLTKQKQDLTASVSDEEREGRDAVTVEAKDYGDMATEAYGQEMSFAISDAGRRSLKDIEDALLRIRDGNFGNCERCTKPIDEARLEAVPSARMCIACAEIVEKESSR
ncbi:MAG: TraR/DksA family transcriptional regulator [Candidatus Coatesbacteria bacterium]